MPSYNQKELPFTVIQELIQVQKRTKEDMKQFNTSGLSPLQIAQATVFFARRNAFFVTLENRPIPKPMDESNNTSVKLGMCKKS